MMLFRFATEDPPGTIVHAGIRHSTHSTLALARGTDWALCTVQTHCGVESRSLHSILQNRIECFGDRQGQAATGEFEGQRGSY